MPEACRASTQESQVCPPNGFNPWGNFWPSTTLTSWYVDYSLNIVFLPQERERRENKLHVYRTCPRDIVEELLDYIDWGGRI